MTERQFPVPSVQSHSSEADLDQFCREYLQALVNNDLIVSYLIAFSRNERTHPNLVSQAREIEIFWTANWPPL